MSLFQQYLAEGKEHRVDQIAKRGDIKEVIFIGFDCETTGLHTYMGQSRNLRQQLSFPLKKELETYFKQNGMHPNDIKGRVSDFRPAADVELAEIAAMAFTIDGKDLGQMHEYVLFDETKTFPKIMKLISWSAEKKEKALKEQKEALDTLENFLNKFDPKNTFIIAHNAAFDLSLIVSIGKKFNHSVASTIRKFRFIDTKKTTKIREIVKNVLPTKEYIKKDGSKGERESNTQEALAKALGIENKKAHTAIEDVRALKEMFLKLVKMVKSE